MLFGNVSFDVWTSSIHGTVLAENWGLQGMREPCTLHYSGVFCVSSTYLGYLGSGKPLPYLDFKLFDLSQLAKLRHREPLQQVEGVVDGSDEQGRFFPLGLFPLGLWEACFLIDLAMAYFRSI
jgi:hypothetical protein